MKDKMKEKIVKYCVICKRLIVRNGGVRKMNRSERSKTCSRQCSQKYIDNYKREYSRKYKRRKK